MKPNNNPIKFKTKIEQKQKKAKQRNCWRKSKRL